MTGPLPAPGPTGVRITGDHYQWLTTWDGCVTALHEDGLRAANPVVAVGVEATDAGNLDDVVLTRARAPHTYTQVKYTVDARSPVNTEWLTKPTAAGGPCLLRKTALAWQQLTAAGGPVEVAIVTNRNPDPGDVLVAGRDSRTRLLLPRAASQGRASKRGKARAVWAEAAGVSEAELLQFLAVLRFDTGRDLPLLQETAGLRMLAAGLRGDPDAVSTGADWVAGQVRKGRRSLDLPTIQAAVNDLGLRQGRSRPVLSIATLKPDPLAAEALHALDWVDRFEGEDAYSKRAPLTPATWQQLQEDLTTIPHHLPGATAVMVTGSLRQATAFTVGTALRMVSGIDLAVAQRGQLWASADHYDTPTTLDPDEHPLDAGPDLAIALEIATPISADVLDYLREAQVPVKHLLVLRPAGGAKDNAVKDAAAANALAVGIRDTVRRAVRGHPRVHLFLAGPMGLSLLLGHRWNRVAPTTVYEDLGAALGYQAAFNIQA